MIWAYSPKIDLVVQMPDDEGFAADMAGLPAGQHIIYFYADLTTID